MLVLPALSVTVNVTVTEPGVGNVCDAVAPEPPNDHEYDVIVRPTGDDALLVNVTGEPAVGAAGEKVNDTVGRSSWTSTVVVAVSV